MISGMSGCPCQGGNSISSLLINLLSFEAEDYWWEMEGYNKVNTPDQILLIPTQNPQFRK